MFSYRVLVLVLVLTLSFQKVLGADEFYLSKNNTVNGTTNERFLEPHETEISTKTDKVFHHRLRRESPIHITFNRKRNTAPCSKPWKVLPQSVNHACTIDKCRVSCKEPNHIFPSGLKQFIMTCIAGRWRYPFENNVVPDCIPVCVPPCQNNGICLESGRCECPDNYDGRFCEHKKSLCEMKPTCVHPLMYSFVNCSSEKCSYNCMDGYQYPNGVRTIILECVNGEWIDLNNGLTSVPDCEPICDPSCKNGGTCISPNKCECPLDFKGSHCQYDLQNVCSEELMEFNGNPLCTFGEEERICTLSCEKGASLSDGTEFFEYKCSYSTGKFSPPIPICVYDIELPSSYPLYWGKPLQPMAPKRGICNLWLGSNVKTFDGTLFKTPLSGTYTLAEETTQAFKVIMKTCPPNSPYNCPHRLEITLGSKLYTLENKDDKIRFSTPNEDLPIPINIDAIQVKHIAENVRVTAFSGKFSILWDRHQYVDVVIGKDYWNRTVGICGTLDGTYRNDFTTKDGVLVKTPEEFVYSWRLQDNSPVPYVQAKIDLFKQCEAQTQRNAIKFCENLLSNHKLEGCFNRLNFDTLSRTCINDYCNCEDKNHPETCVCVVVAILVKQCKFIGKKLDHDWRNLEICPIKCSEGREYRSCGPNVEPICGSAAIPIRSRCVEGCFCPEGTIQNKNTCIPLDQCPCLFGGKEYPSGSTIKKDCNTCSCEKGTWTCTDKLCGSKCQACGDPHYVTFDGKRFDFMGKLSYYLLKTHNMTVEAENEPCNGLYPSCTKSLTIKVPMDGSTTIIKLDPRRVVRLNGNEINKFPTTLGNGKIVIQSLSSAVTVDFSDGVSVWWNGYTTWQISVPGTYREKTSGVCGTFNSNADDDFLTPEGALENDVVIFGNKWSTSETASNEIPDYDVAEHPCDKSDEARKKADKHCAWLTNDVFKDCKSSVEYDAYYDNCLYDVCSCEAEASKCYCPILSSYASECTKQGINIDWRKTIKECGVKCPDRQIQDDCCDVCTRTCRDIALNKTCEKQCVQGCRCPDGEHLNDQDVCVPSKECPCLHDGESFQVGDKHIRQGNATLQLCTCMGAVWNCTKAQSNDTMKYPRSAELVADCGNKSNAVFSSCVPKNTKSCWNMHDYIERLEDCAPGCACREGYVFDTLTKECVNPEDCSCSQGGKKYSNGDKQVNDCNVCVCRSGKWECTADDCDGTCAVWGDSHFTSFDNNFLDFKGTCEYVLSKGTAANGDRFSITIQDVLSAKYEATSSIALEIELGGSITDTITFSQDKRHIRASSESSEDHVSEGRQYHIYKAGLFTVVEIVPYKIQVKWDTMTRAYVRLGKEWKGRVSGLCGNYNGITNDDMQTPSGGLEMRPTLFAHSWRLQKDCAVPKEQIDFCTKRGYDEEINTKICDNIKALPEYKECHSKVPFEKYYKRCKADLCIHFNKEIVTYATTVIAAYNHACSMKGVHIPTDYALYYDVQCDYTKFKECTPACGVKTCDNILDEDVPNRMCLKEYCFHGCWIEPCQEGLIYSNDSFKQCIPKAECKPLCMVKDEKKFYEGDITYTDKCQTCWCTKKKEICSGAPCTGTGAVSPGEEYSDSEFCDEESCEQYTTPFWAVNEETTTLQPDEANRQFRCVSGWTRWFNDNSEELNDDDKENPQTFDPSESIYGSCNREFVTKIERRTPDTHAICSLDEVTQCDSGNVEVRRFCQCEEKHVTSATTSETEKATQCPAGKVWSDCANHCEHTCHYYGLILKKRGLCNAGDLCIGGCVDDNEPNCAELNKFWRDRSTCVESDECPCMSMEEEYIKPHSIYIENHQSCQCVDNTVICVGSAEPIGVTTVMPDFPVFDWTTSKEAAFTTEKPFIESDFIKKPLIVPSSVTTPPRCNHMQLIPMTGLPGTVFNASSTLSDSFSPNFARLHAQPNVESKGCWSPLVTNQMQYWEVIFKEAHPLFGVIVQGNPILDEYVTLYKILHSNDGVAFQNLIDETDEVQLFKGSIDARTPVKSFFQIPIETKVVRIYPLKWHAAIAIRVELLGCGEGLEETMTDKHSEEPPKIPTITANSWREKPKCTDPMGIENGIMHPIQIKASTTSARHLHLADSLKLSSSSSWKPLVNSQNEYIEIDFLELRNITGISTKGGGDGWVTAYSLMYSTDPFIWNNLLGSDGKPYIFHANYDLDTEQTNFFEVAIQTQKLRIVPVKWEISINMRVELIGCFKPYSNISKSINSKPNNCPLCDNVISDDKDCKCKEPKAWDGSKCVDQKSCPCIVDYMRYPVGSKFDGKSCEECVCLLGGVRRCKPMKCPACEEGQRIQLTSVCTCKCEMCPDKHRLCPSSGDCIPESSWCNGVKDCADDEASECPKSEGGVTTEVKAAKSQFCPEPQCPRGMKLTITKNSATRRMSQIFYSMPLDKISLNIDSPRYIKQFISSSEAFLPTPEQQPTYNEAKPCVEYMCEPKGSFTDSPLKCPDDFEIYFDHSRPKSGELSTYTCTLKPLKDHVCEINGKSIVTFDGSEFRYEAFNHVLARSLINSTWFISVNLNCSEDRKTCRKILTINDVSVAAILTVMPSLELQLNGFPYTAQQLEMSPLVKSLYIVSQVGDTILVVSRLHGFWVSYNKIGDTKIGISEKFIKTVDGLCGYFNGNPFDDKRLPDGKTTISTPKFGDSWLTKGSPKDEFTVQMCAEDMQREALMLCSTIEHTSFLECSKALNYKRFVSKCMDSACECLKANNGDTKACKCSILQGFVQQCMAVSPDIQLDTWRAVHKCEVSCPMPFVQMDCYRRRCEPSCNNLNGDDCPVLKDICFSGCFCPKGTLRKGDRCISINECQDCSCDAFGTSRYLTFDGKTFTFNGNCTYLMSRDILMPDEHSFQVYVSMDDCKKSDHTSKDSNTSCVKALHVLHGEHIIHIQRSALNIPIAVIIDGVELKRLSFEDSWFGITETKGNGIKLTFPTAHVDVTCSFDDMAFSIRVPRSIYGSKMEGMCGDCNGDPGNDLQPNPLTNSRTSNLEDFVQSWQEIEPKLRLDQGECMTKEVSVESISSLPPETDPCFKLLDEKLFGKCHMIVSPLVYVSACQKDMNRSRNEEKQACNSLAAYARECARMGICLDWRSENLCPYDCPAYLVFEPCGCVRTCNIINKPDLMKNRSAVNLKEELDCIASEGCICPSGEVLDFDKCVVEERCIKCDEGKHSFGDVWKKDKCTVCNCSRDGKTECIQQQCEEFTCPEGYITLRADLSSDEECCQHTCISIPCNQPPVPKCGQHQVRGIKEDANGCPQAICECMPATECEALHDDISLKPGENIFVNYAGCCPLAEIICDTNTCPNLTTECPTKFHTRDVFTHPGDCCPTVECHPPKDACIVKIDGRESRKNLSEIWSVPEHPCKIKMCAYGLDSKTEVYTITQTCNKKCPKGFVYQRPLSPSICCGICIPIVATNQCQPISLSEKETTQMIRVAKLGHGICVNKEPILGFTRCYGSCESGTSFNLRTFDFATMCTKCSGTEHKKVLIPLTCQDGLSIFKEVEIPSSCGCVDC